MSEGDQLCDQKCHSGEKKLDKWSTFLVLGKCLSLCLSKIFLSKQDQKIKFNLIFSSLNFSNFVAHLPPFERMRKYDMEQQQQSC